MVGAAIAIVLGKHVYGGLGQNLFNPAMLARVALLISFPIEMTTWANVSPLFTGPGVIDSLAITFGGLQNADAVTGATTLGYVKTEFSQGRMLPGSLLDYSGFLAFLGWERGSLGETSSLLILAGGIWLIRQGVIKWHIPVSLLLTIFLLSSLFHLLDATHYLTMGAFEFRRGDAGGLLYCHRLRHIAEYAARANYFRCRLRPVDLRDPHLGRLSGRHRLCDLADECGDAADRPLHPSAHLRPLP